MLTQHTIAPLAETLRGFISAASSVPLARVQTNGTNIFERDQTNSAGQVLRTFVHTPPLGCPTAPITTTAATSSTTLSVMDLARRMAREREEMMRRGQT